MSTYNFLRAQITPQTPSLTGREYVDRMNAALDPLYASIRRELGESNVLYQECITEILKCVKGRMSFTGWSAQLQEIIDSCPKIEKHHEAVAFLFRDMGINIKPVEENELDKLLKEYKMDDKVRR
ncbi:hypothetical protein K504DRAFT_490922 [Pleomassaria siparia CBS 279.74]|uniref:Uncharacterized protein n=1 Tax=Pleomassaria siparia CBS 279.74 TaxID=1314801 RepID=A0A6G1KAF4_9PLEO|nr:hypothetical protein K504DRAFT_490922 [Pleomassaria siparia CBS 279.74]